MQVYRISKCNYIEDLSGQGAARFPGRWNSKGTYVLYTAASPSLSLLESVVHLSKIPSEGFCMLSLEIPEASFLELSVSDLPENWFSHPPAERLKEIGDTFVKEGKYLALKVPSAIIPEEFNFILNPNHKDFYRVKILYHRSLVIDERLLRK